MAYSVSFLFQLKVQLVRTIAHAPSSSSTVVSVGFFEDMWIPLVHLPQPCALYASFYSPSPHPPSCTPPLTPLRVCTTQRPQRTRVFLAAKLRGNINPRTARLSRIGAPVHRPGRDRARACGERRILRRRAGSAKSDRGWSHQWTSTASASAIHGDRKSPTILRQRAASTLTPPPVVLHCRAGPRANSVVEGVRGHDGRRVNHFSGSARRKMLLGDLACHL